MELPKTFSKDPKQLQPAEEKKKQIRHLRNNLTAGKLRESFDSSDSCKDSGNGGIQRNTIPMKKRSKNKAVNKATTIEKIFNSLGQPYQSSEVSPRGIKEKDDTEEREKEPSRA